MLTQTLAILAVIVVCALVIVVCQLFELHRNWFVNPLISGLMSASVMLAYPQAQTLGSLTPLAVWAVLAIGLWHLPAHPRAQPSEDDVIFNLFEEI